MSAHSITIDGQTYTASAEAIVRLYGAVVDVKTGGRKMLCFRRGERYDIVFVGPETAISISTTDDVLDVLGVEASHVVPLDDQEPQ